MISFHFHVFSPQTKINKKQPDDCIGRSLALLKPGGCLMEIGKRGGDLTGRSREILWFSGESPGKSYLGKIPIWLIFFQMGWNYQPVMESVLFFWVPPCTTRFPLKTHSRSNYDTEYLWISYRFGFDSGSNLQPWYLMFWQYFCWYMGDLWDLWNWIIVDGSYSWQVFSGWILYGNIFGSDD